MTDTSNFASDFRAWLRASLIGVEIPEEVAAFAFNIFDSGTSENQFGIELIGTVEFDPSDSAWAGDELWEPEARHFPIPDSFAGRNWEQCQEKIRDLLTEIIESDDEIAAILTSREGMGIGYVDGELEILEFE